ncbi:type II toxin-antitoxin system HicB family antitoxin [Thiococcus pfennigii]|uniref:type II toxin-antitoxin system HicB family antitoxin n=1 Tax=Thiococcus pfennigii TaxID=1057 RepID=UPI0019031C1C|nr:type II toxin-antitoxin system HicB family antitoxin [Thiococcus pfennigii]MBK1701901.1 hypothetical protein [Thiococcus pfennigii]MBK1730368.1 hypothetical protein [Thiococcus pfennigii]
MNTMKYKDYVARIEYDEDDRIFVGHLAGIDDIVGFHGTTVDELKANFHEAVERCLEISERTGRPPQRPYSGKLMLRVSPEIHAAVATAAQVQGKSIDRWAADVRTEAGIEPVATIRPYLSTLHEQGADIFQALVLTFQGSPPMPKLG